MGLLSMDSVKLTFAVLVFVSCQAAHAQDASTKIDEPKVKAGVEEAAVLDICPDRTLLEVAEIDVGDCRSHIAKLAPICWHLIDGIVSDYVIEQGEAGKDRFIRITVVYASCVRAELLRQIVRSRRESNSP